MMHRLLLSLLAISVLAGQATIADNILFARDPRSLTRRQILDKVSQGITEDAVRKYETFEKYWDVVEKSRTGKFAEASVALKFQRSIASTNEGYTLYPTALDNPADPFDHLLMNKEGKVVARYQMKLGQKAAIAALSNPKYAAAKILVPQDTLEIIGVELRKQIAKVTRRGLPLSDEWFNVEDALRRGRLTDTVYGGNKVPTRGRLLEEASRYFKKVFTARTKDMEEAASAVIEISGTTRLSRISRTLHFGGRALGVTGIGVSLYQAAGDYERWNAGKIETSDFAARLSGRMLLAAAGTYSIFWAGGPVGLGVGAVILVSETAWSEYDRAQDQLFQQTLGTLERDDRFAEARYLLMVEYQSVTQRNDGGR